MRCSPMGIFENLYCKLIFISYLCFVYPSWNISLKKQGDLFLTVLVFNLRWGRQIYVRPSEATLAAAPVHEWRSVCVQSLWKESGDLQLSRPIAAWENCVFLVFISHPHLIAQPLRDSSFQAESHMASMRRPNDTCFKKLTVSSVRE